MLRLLVTGSRTWSDAGCIWRTLDELLARHGGIVLVHGACAKGADAHAHGWAQRRQAEGANVLIEAHPANWGRYGRAAGMTRNAEMVKALGADGGEVACHAFIRDDSRGASHCAKHARRAGIPVTVHRYEEASRG